MVFMLVTCCYEKVVIEVHLLDYWNGIVVKELQYFYYCHSILIRFKNLQLICIKLFVFRAIQGILHSWRIGTGFRVPAPVSVTARH